MNLIAAIPVMLTVCLVSASGAQKVTRSQKAPVAAHTQPVVPAPVPVVVPPPQKKVSESASPEYLERLLKLTPEQRNKALSSLPSPRRTQILAKLDNYQKIPPKQRAKLLDQYQRMQKLPPQKRAEVRAALQKFKDMPDPRHKQIQTQINQMSNLSDADRSALMNSEEFRSKYTPAEQQMIGNISLLEAKR